MTTYMYIRSSALLNKIRYAITPIQKHLLKGIITKPKPYLNSMLSFEDKRLLYVFIRSR